MADDLRLGSAKLVAFVATCDLARAGAFYGDVLGLGELDSSPFARVFDAAGTVVRVTLVSGHVPVAQTVLGWPVPDIEAALDGLARRGVEAVRYDGMEQDERGIWTAPGSTRVAWFRDPDGNTLSLSQ